MSPELFALRHLLNWHTCLSISLVTLLASPLLDGGFIAEQPNAMFQRHSGSLENVLIHTTEQHRIGVQGGPL